MTEDQNETDLDQFFDECASTQIGSVTLKIRQYQAGDTSVTNDMWVAVIEQLRERASEILANFPSVSKEKEPDDLINDLFERLSRILAGEVIKIKHRGDFYRSACRNFVWHLHDTLKKRSHSEFKGELPVDPLAAETGPETKTERDELYTLALEEVGKLPEDLREIFDLRFGGGLTFREIEEEIGVAKSTAEEKWAKAKALLRQKLQP